MKRTEFYKKWKEGWNLFYSGDIEQSLLVFEDAHYDGMFSTPLHFKAHYAKLRIALRQKHWLVAFIQCVLMLLAPLSGFTYLLYRIHFFLPMHPSVKFRFETEMQQAKLYYQQRNDVEALACLGRAHILASHFCFPHLRTHAAMLKIEWVHKNYRGIFIQVTRTIGALGTRFLIHFFGVTGNPGWSECGIGSRHLIADDLKQLLDKQGLL